MAKNNVKYTTVALHAFIWSLLFVLPHFFIDNRNASPRSLPGSFFTIINLYHVGLFYLNALVLCPLFFNKKRWWIYILTIALLLAVSYYLKWIIVKAWYPEVIIDKWARHILFFSPVPFLVISTIYHAVVSKIARDKRQKEIVAEQLAIKLKFLRSQISPHFIFNVLTNLVSLARKKSDQLETQLIKLSELMRYVLYESDEKKIPLSSEVEYLKSYIELQTLRFGHDVTVETDLRLSEHDRDRRIEPMLLIPFVENAFKHGMGIDKPFIKVLFVVNQSNLEFDVKNKFETELDETKDGSPGIGLENVRSRLDILYPNQYQLLVNKENNLFHVHLTLQLK